eukprot:gene3727-6615_t
MNTKATQARGVQFWTVEVLSKLFLKPGDSLLELYSENGTNLGKWERSKIKKYCSIDVSEKSSMNTKKKWQERGQKFEAIFLHQSPIEPFNFNQKFDSVVCFQNMGDNFKSIESSKKYLSNIYECMKNESYFYGMMFDSSSIWLKIQKYGKENIDRVEFDLKLFKLSLPLNFEKIQPYFGFKLNLKVLGEDLETNEYFIHCQSFLEIANEIGFEVISITNLYEFYEDHKYMFQDSLDAYRVFKDQNRKLDSFQKEVIELYSIFILKKN